MQTLGAELSQHLFQPVGWTDYPVTAPGDADYPGLRPTGSWRLDPDGAIRGLDPTATGWHDRQSGEPVDLTGRRLVLAYGSNPDPGKLLGQRRFLGGDSVIALRAAVFGWVAVWCKARRSDGSVVATLAEAPGWMEIHPVLALTAHQLDAMDRWEGHPHTYRRTRHRGDVLLESGWRAEGVEVYLGTDERRPVLLVDGGPLRCAEVPHEEVDRMVPW